MTPARAEVTDIFRSVAIEGLQGQTSMMAFICGTLRSGSMDLNQPLAHCEPGAYSARSAESCQGAGKTLRGSAVGTTPRGTPP